MDTKRLESSRLVDEAFTASAYFRYVAMCADMLKRVILDCGDVNKMLSVALYEATTILLVAMKLGKIDDVSEAIEDEQHRYSQEIIMPLFDRNDVLDRLVYSLSTFNVVTEFEIALWYGSLVMGIVALELDGAISRGFNPDEYLDVEEE